MSQLFLDRTRKLLILLLCIVTMLTACSKSDQKVSSAETNAGITSVTPSAQSALRTDEVFDTKKYDNLFTARFFLMKSSIKSGDSIFLKTPDGVTILIDSGTTECGPQVVDYLKKLGVKKLDYIVASHLHQDHVGGFPAVINAFEIGKALVPNYEYKTTENKNFQKALTDKNIAKEFLKEGDTFKFGNDIQVEILSPEPEIVIPANVVPENSAAVANNLSIVMKMTYKQKSFLFVGDIYKEREAKLVKDKLAKLDVDFLKAPHHGGDTSSSSEFIDAVSPKFTVFTSNSGFSQDRYDKYRKAGSNVYITGVDGNILLTSDGNNINVITEKDRFGNILK